jgi:hypothetical protein
MEAVGEKLLEVRNKYVALIDPQRLEPGDKRKYLEANHDLFSLKGVLQDLRREMEPYIKTTKGEKYAKKTK